MSTKTFDISITGTGGLIELELVTDSSGRVLSFDSAVAQSEYFKIYGTPSYSYDTNSGQLYRYLQARIYSDSGGGVGLSRDFRYDDSKKIQVKIYTSYAGSTHVYSGLVKSISTDDVKIYVGTDSAGRVYFPGCKIGYKREDEDTYLGVHPFDTTTYANSAFYYKVIETNETTHTGTATGGSANTLQDSGETDFRYICQIGDTVETTTPTRTCTISAVAQNTLTFVESDPSNPITSSTSYSLVFAPRASRWGKFYSGSPEKTYYREYSQWTLLCEGNYTAGPDETMTIEAPWPGFTQYATSIKIFGRDYTDPYAPEIYSSEAEKNVNRKYEGPFTFAAGHDTGTDGGAIEVSTDPQYWFYYADEGGGASWQTYDGSSYTTLNMGASVYSDIPTVVEWSTFPTLGSRKRVGGYTGICFSISIDFSS